MMHGCSTPQPSEPISAAALCPHPSVYASYATFNRTTEVKSGETAFQTVKRFRIAEKEKNASGRRLWNGLKSCRTKNAKPDEKERSITEILIGGL